MGLNIKTYSLAFIYVFVLILSGIAGGTEGDKSEDKQEQNVTSFVDATHFYHEINLLFIGHILAKAKLEELKH